MAQALQHVLQVLQRFWYGKPYLALAVALIAAAQIAAMAFSLLYLASGGRHVQLGCEPQQLGCSPTSIGR